MTLLVSVLGENLERHSMTPVPRCPQRDQCAMRSLEEEEEEQGNLESWGFAVDLLVEMEAKGEH